MSPTLTRGVMAMSFSISGNNVMLRQTALDPSSAVGVTSRSASDAGPSNLSTSATSASVNWRCLSRCRMLKPFWLRCESCEHEWASDFDTENGMLVAAYHSGEHCPECESNAVEVVNECEVD